MTDWQQGYDAYWSGEPLDESWPTSKQAGWTEAEEDDWHAQLAGECEPPLGWYEDDFDNYPFAGENQ